MQRLIARVLIGSLFLVTALHGFMNFREFAKFVSTKLPAAIFLAAIALSIKLLGSLAVISGAAVSQGAAVLLAFLVIVTPIYHDFWRDSSQFNDFFKNVAVMGGLLLLIDYSNAF